MELLFVTVIAIFLGAIIRYSLPRRGTYGSLLLPAITGAVTALVWVALVWAGWKFDATWIWVASLSAGIATGLATALLLPRRRIDADASKLARLSHG